MHQISGAIAPVFCLLGVCLGVKVASSVDSELTYQTLNPESFFTFGVCFAGQN